MQLVQNIVLKGPEMTIWIVNSCVGESSCFWQIVLLNISVWLTHDILMVENEWMSEYGIGFK